MAADRLAAGFARNQSAAVEGEEYLDAPEAEEAIAAAEVVAAATGQPAAQLPDAVRAWIASNPAALSANEAQLALSAVDRVDERRVRVARTLGRGRRRP
jgi:hypothetical protein